jgi:hypothetical protein
MKLLLNREIPLVDADLESKPHRLWVNYDVVLAQKINLAAEESMIETMWWLEQNSEFDAQKLYVILEDDSIKLIHE